MKFQPDRSSSPMVLQFDGAVARIGMQHEGQAQVHERSSSFLLSSRLGLMDWSATSFENLETEDFAQIAALGAQVVLVGTGDKLRFPAPQLLQPLMLRRIGAEYMDNASACRTYNVLSAEGRDVILALLLPAQQASSAL